jgi:hypothetical protein
MRDSGEVFFTAEQIAKRWHWHAESVRRWVRRGQVASVVIGGRRLVPVAEIQEIERQGLVPRKSEETLRVA